MLYLTVRDFWRVGHHADPLGVTLEYQDGSGRFDDPFREKVVLYGADDVRTCILEIALPWRVAAGAAALRNVPPPRLEPGEDDPDLLRAMQTDAARDEAFAAEPNRLPSDLYDKTKIHVDLSHAVDVLKLDEISVTRALFAVPAIKSACNADAITQIDRGVLTGRSLDVTRSISGHLMREQIFGAYVPGIASPSRHPSAGVSLVLFDVEETLRGHRAIHRSRLTPDDPDVLRVAADLGLPA